LSLRSRPGPQCRPCLSSCGSGRGEKRRDGVMELLVAPTLQAAPPIGGGEGAFCDDCGVLVMDEVSGSGYIPVRHEMPLSTLSHCSAIFASKKGLGGRGVLKVLTKAGVSPSYREGLLIATVCLRGPRPI